jgi:hypothetical protein
MHNDWGMEIGTGGVQVLKDWANNLQLLIL